jgi:hypothetical protein
VEGFEEMEVASCGSDLLRWRVRLGNFWNGFAG